MDGCCLNLAPVRTSDKAQSDNLYDVAMSTLLFPVPVCIKQNTCDLEQISRRRWPDLKRAAHDAFHTSLYQLTKRCLITEINDRMNPALNRPSSKQ